MKFLELADSKLRKAFEEVAPDFTKDREKAVKRIMATKEKFTATEPIRGRKDYAIGGGNVVQFALMHNGTPVVIDKQDSFFVPAERFPDFLDAMAASVTAGELDKELAANGETGTVSSQMKAVGVGIVRHRAPRSDAGQPREGWTPERRAKHAATIAARKAAKAGK
jgi:hypothetical protein